MQTPGKRSFLAIVFGGAVGMLGILWLVTGEVYFPDRGIHLVGAQARIVGLLWAVFFFALAFRKEGNGDG